MESRVMGNCHARFGDYIKKLPITIEDRFGGIGCAAIIQAAEKDV